MTLPHLDEESLHLPHGFVQLLLSVSGSLQGVIRSRHCAVTVQTSAVTVPVIVTATCSPTGAFPTGGVAWGSTYLVGQVSKC